MPKSTEPLATVLADLSARAREGGLTDTAWAERAGVRKETLSRLRGRNTCDFSTLSALAEAVGAQLTVAEPPAAATSGRHFPERMDREYEGRLLDLCASRTLEPGRWEQLGPRFFMSGLAVMLASTRDFDRRSLLTLAEELHPGASEPAVFARWLKASPLRPSRFLPMLSVRVKRAA
jgi:DNA-binding phage protein